MRLFASSIIAGMLAIGCASVPSASSQAIEEPTGNLTVHRFKQEMYNRRYRLYLQPTLKVSQVLAPLCWSFMAEPVQIET